MCVKDEGRSLIMVMGSSHMRIDAYTGKDRRPCFEQRAAKMDISFKQEIKSTVGLKKDGE